MRLMESLATTGPLAEVFSDESVLQAMLDFEAALARVQARLKIIPEDAAKVISSCAETTGFDMSRLAQETLRAGTPAIPLVRALTEKASAKDSAAAGYVHWGATSQDVADTALVLLLKRAQGIIEADLQRVEAALVNLAGQHKDTVMLGRTLLQAAPPTTFGLKAAGWLAAIHRSRNRLNQSFREALMVQFGGASGTAGWQETRGASGCASSGHG